MRLRCAAAVEANPGPFAECLWFLWQHCAVLGVSQKRVGAPLHGKHMAGLFLKGAATVCTERHTRLELLHKLCRESSQFVQYMVIKTVNAMKIPSQETVLLNTTFSVYKGNVSREIEHWLIIKSKSSLHVVVSEQKGSDCSHVTCQFWLFIVISVYIFSYWIK